MLSSIFRFWTYCMQQRTDSKCLKVKKQLSTKMSQMNIESLIFIIFPFHHHCLINSTVYMYFEFEYAELLFYLPRFIYHKRRRLIQRLKYNTLCIYRWFGLTGLVNGCQPSVDPVYDIPYISYTVYQKDSNSKMAFSISSLCPSKSGASLNSTWPSVSISCFLDSNFISVTRNPEVFEKDR